MLTAQDIIDRVRDQLQDTSELGYGYTYRYSDAKLLSYITLGMRMIAFLKPSANSGLTTHTCTAAPRQRLDPTAFHLAMRIQWNEPTIISPGNTGDVIATVERDVFDTFYNMWPTSTAVPGDAPIRFTAAAMDAKDPLAFWLFPTPREGDVVYLTVCYIPDPVEYVIDEIWLGNEYTAPLVDFVCHMASISVGRDEAAQHAERYLVSFLTALGVSTTIIQEVSMNQPAAPEATE